MIDFISCVFFHSFLMERRLKAVTCVMTAGHTGGEAEWEVDVEVDCPDQRPPMTTQCLPLRWGRSQARSRVSRSDPGPHLSLPRGPSGMAQRLAEDLGQLRDGEPGRSPRPEAAFVTQACGLNVESRRCEVALRDSAGAGDGDYGDGRITSKIPPGARPGPQSRPGACRPRRPIVSGRRPLSPALSPSSSA
ncbi:hypothetical protein H1C71_015473 [Ictidomys tridecemlineatus]|nr:hypothetical protein H1C71_015473 [Ictidomys tridecemlineatus]